MEANNRTNVFYSPEGNPEVWEKKPKGYLTEAEWKAAHPEPEPESPTLDEARAIKFAEISQIYREYDTTGTIMTSAGYPLQTGMEHCVKLDGAIRFAEMTKQTVIYITDAKDVTHYAVPLEMGKKILIEQMGAALTAHTKKQGLRAQVEAAETVEKINAVEIVF